MLPVAGGGCVRGLRDGVLLVLLVLFVLFVLLVHHRQVPSAHADDERAHRRGLCREHLSGPWTAAIAQWPARPPPGTDPDPGAPAVFPAGVAPPGTPGAYAGAPRMGDRP